jgi:pimeloyl-ACP methyl ester carboxylesterase
MRSRRRLRWLIYAFTMYFALCLIGGIYLADATLRPPRRPLTEQDVASVHESLIELKVQMEDVTVTAPDAAVMRAWLLRPVHPSGDAAILLHGLGDNRLGMIGYAEFLLAHGFTVLLPDARAHGISGGALATYGLLERNDIHQWFDLLSTEMHPRCIYGLGESMGAAELLQSLQIDIRFCSVIAESRSLIFAKSLTIAWGSLFIAGLGLAERFSALSSTSHSFVRAGSTNLICGRFLHWMRLPRHMSQCCSFTVKSTVISPSAIPD